MRGSVEAAVGALVEREQQRDEPDRERGDAGVVDAVLGGVAARRATIAPASRARAKAAIGTLRKKIQRQLERVGEEPAEHRPDGVAEPGHAEDEAAGQAGLVSGRTA